MAKTLLDQSLPLIDGIYALDPAAAAEYVAAANDLVTSQLTNLTAEIGYLGCLRVMRVQQYFQMLLGVTMTLTLPPPVNVIPSVATSYGATACQLNSLLYAALTTGGQPWPTGWTNPDYVLGSLGDPRDLPGLFTAPPSGGGLPIIPTYINTIPDEQNVTSFRILVDYTNSLLNAWTTSIQFFAGPTSQFLGTQLVVISHQLGVISETVDEVRFVLDSVFIGPSPRETYQISSSGLGLPPIYLEDLLNWIQNFVGKEAQDAITNGGKPGIGLEFITMMTSFARRRGGFTRMRRPRSVPRSARSECGNRCSSSRSSFGTSTTSLPRSPYPYLAPR